MSLLIEFDVGLDIASQDRLSRSGFGLCPTIDMSGMIAVRA